MKILFLLAFIFSGFIAAAQGFSLTDTTITFKSVSGKVMTTNEVLDFAQQGGFNAKTEILPDGKKIVTLSHPDAKEKSDDVKENYKWMFTLRGSQLPSFNLKDYQHKIINSSSLKGHVVIINFWFTQCKPCIAEMPGLNTLVKENPDKNIIFLAPTFESLQAVQKFLPKFPFNFRIIPDARLFIDKMKVPVYPTTLIIDKNGIIRDVFVGTDIDLISKIQVALDLLK